LLRRHDRLATRARINVELQSAARARGHLHRARRQPRRAHVLDTDQAIRLEQLEARFEQELFQERIADLDGGPLRLALLVELRRRHGGAVNAVAPGPCADVDDRIAHARRSAAEDAIRLEEPEGECVDETVAVVAVVESDFAPDRRYADAIAVTADARHHAFEEARGLGMRRLAEPQPAERRDR